MPFSHDQYAKKGLIYARFDLGEGQTLGVINVHTAYSEKTGFSNEHKQQLSEVVAAAKKVKEENTYFVMGGDFNAGPDMGFKNTTFDASPWEQVLEAPLRADGIRMLESVGITWDETNNALVRIPPLLLRLVNKYKNGYIGWDMTDSTLDHIFVQDDVEVTRHELAFTKKVPLNCGKRDDANGLLNLSDHYGVMAVIKTEK
jgi:endonuclease/exonuclease/phosphatase family metal-dependent hydrolase